MPTTAGHQVRTVADIFMVLTNCTRKEADAAEQELCKSPDAIATLAVACGISTAAVGAGGKLVVAGIPTAGAVSIGGFVLGGAGLYGAKKFCNGFLKQSMKSVGSAGSNSE